MKNKKILASLSIIIPCLSYVFSSLVFDDSVKGVLIGLIIVLIFSIVGVVFGFVTKKEEKIISIVSIVVNFILILMCLLGIVGTYFISVVNNCVRTQNEITTCELNGVEVKDIPTSSLRDDQYKDSEGE